jgi:cobalt-zinc-cadmium resistance protein CzcA
VLRSGFTGEVSGLVFENEKRFDLVVRLRLENRQRLEDIKGLYVTAPSGMQIPLEQLANIELTIGPNQIQRDDAKRRIAVGFNVRNRDVQTIVEEINAKISTTLKFEPGYYVTYGGSFKNLEEATQRLVIAVPLALALIFLL